MRLTYPMAPPCCFH